MNMSLRRRPRGCATPVVMAGAALALTGCTDSVPVQRDTPIYTITVPDRWPYRDNGTYAPPVAYPRPAPAPPPSYSFIPRAEAAPAAPQTTPPPLRPVDPPDAVPVDQSCGWWRLCNLWSGS